MSNSPLKKIKGLFGHEINIIISTRQYRITLYFFFYIIQLSKQVYFIIIRIINVKNNCQLLKK